VFVLVYDYLEKRANSSFRLGLRSPMLDELFEKIARGPALRNFAYRNMGNLAATRHQTMVRLNNIARQHVPHVGARQVSQPYQTSAISLRNLPPPPSLKELCNIREKALPMLRAANNAFQRAEDKVMPIAQKALASSGANSGLPSPAIWRLTGQYFPTTGNIVTDAPGTLALSATKDLIHRYEPGFTRALQRLDHRLNPNKPFSEGRKQILFGLRRRNADRFDFKPLSGEIEVRPPELFRGKMAYRTIKKIQTQTSSTVLVELIFVFSANAPNGQVDNKNK